MTIGFGASDKMGESPLAGLTEAYKEQQLKSKRFVHVRKKRSSNRDLWSPQKVASGDKIYAVDLKSQGHKGDEIGEVAESILTNSQHLAEIIEKANCRTCEDVDEAVGEKMKKQRWDVSQTRCEPHMQEEDTVRLDWQDEMFEDGDMKCETCGDRNAWDRVHVCCYQQCKGILNALQAFPFAAWDDVAAAELNPEAVAKVRKVEIRYAERKPVWRKIPRHIARSTGWEIIKSR